GRVEGSPEGARTVAGPAAAPGHHESGRRKRDMRCALRTGRELVDGELASERRAVAVESASHDFAVVGRARVRGPRHHEIAGWVRSYGGESRPEELSVGVDRKV